MVNNFVKRNLILVSLCLYIILYSALIFSKSHLIYNKNGTIRNFGIGYSTRSVIPVWLLSIVLAIASYFIVLYYVSYSVIYF